MKHLKILNHFFSFLVLLISFTGCFTSYQKYNKTPCADLGSNSQTSVGALAVETGYNAQNIELTNEYMQYARGRGFEYLQIKKVMILTKKMLRGTRYTIVIVLKDRQKHTFQTYNFNLAIKAYSTLECFAGIIS